MINENFILMCKQAEEIQEAWKVENGDWVFWRVTKSIKIITDHFDTKNLKDFIWLPTQEQLQEIILPILKEGHKKFWDMKKINFWIIRLLLNFIDDDYYNSFNELWLAFVMYEKYHKIWSNAGERWVMVENYEKA